MHARIGIDLGGTKIEIAALDQNNATVLRRRIATPAGDYAATVQAIVDLVRRAKASSVKRRRSGLGPRALSRARPA